MLDFLGGIFALLVLIYFFVGVFGGSAKDTKIDKEMGKIKKVQIVGNYSESQKKVSSSITRAAIGGALLGPAGMIGGAVSGKDKITDKTTFLILYRDGHKETKTVNNNSAEYQALIKKIDL